jgi:hypothetical protein
MAPLIVFLPPKNQESAIAKLLEEEDEGGVCGRSTGARGGAQ